MDQETRKLLGESVNLLLKEGRFAEAVPHLEQLVKLDPGDFQMVADLACAYQQAGNYGKAIERFEEIVTIRGLAASEESALYERLGYCRLANKEHQEAAHAFGSALALQENSSRSYVGLGLVMVETGRTAEARSLFERAIASDPGCADAYNNLGALACSEGRYEEALDLLRRALEIDPAHKDALPNYLSIAFTLELYERAESLLMCYTSELPDNTDLSYQLAYCRFKRGDKKQAQELLQKILTANPGHEDARGLLAQCTAA